MNVRILWAGFGLAAVAVLSTAGGDWGTAHGQTVPVVQPTQASSGSSGGESSGAAESASASPAATAAPAAASAAATSAPAGSGAAQGATMPSGSPLLSLAGRESSVPVAVGIPAGQAFASSVALPGGQSIGVSIGGESVARLASLGAGGTARLVFEPAPELRSEVEAGSLGGGVVVPAGRPVDLKIEIGGGARPAAAEALEGVEVRLQLPVTAQPSRPDAVFAWLHALYDRQGEFLGYVRPPAEFDPPTGTLSVQVSANALQGTLFLPAFIVPAWVANHDPEVHIFSGPTADAVDYGLAGPPFTTFVVVAPQVGSRVFVYNSATDNYGWIDVSGIGPAAAPE